MTTSTNTYKKAYEKLVAKNSEVILNKNNEVISFEEYVKFCKNRIANHKRDHYL